MKVALISMLISAVVTYLSCMLQWVLKPRRNEHLDMAQEVWRQEHAHLDRPGVSMAEASIALATFTGAGQALTSYLQRPRSRRCPYCDRTRADDATCPGCGAPR